MQINPKTPTVARLSQTMQSAVAHAGSALLLVPMQIRALRSPFIEEVIEKSVRSNQLFSSSHRTCSTARDHSVHEFLVPQQAALFGLACLPHAVLAAVV